MIVRNKGGRMHRALVAVGLGLLLPVAAFAACTDPAAVAAARATAETECPCATATSHGAHVRCVAQVASDAGLSGQCRAAVVNCASRSTCGRPGSVCPIDPGRGELI
jgi:hypothetical protein